MATSALLIGFRYSGQERLPGIRIDLTLAYQYATKVLKVNPKNLLLLTDLPEELEDYEEEISKESDYRDIKTLVKRAKELNQYCFFGSESKGDELILRIAQLCSTSTKLFFYYSGHGVTLKENGIEHSSILLPKLKVICNDDLYAVLRKNLGKETQMFCIVDCCHSGTIFDLDWILNGASFKPYKPVCGKTDQICLNDRVRASVVCFSACENAQKAAAMNRGSLFTKMLIHYLLDERNSRNLFTISTNVRGRILNFSNRRVFQKPTVTSSRQEMDLWDWVYGRVPVIEIQDGKIVVKNLDSK